MDGYGSGNESMEMTPIFLRKCGKQETIRKHKKHEKEKCRENQKWKHFGKRKNKIANVKHTFWNHETKKQRPIPYKTLCKGIYPLYILYRELTRG